MTAASGLDHGCLDPAAAARGSTYSSGHESAGPENQLLCEVNTCCVTSVSYNMFCRPSTSCTAIDITCKIMYVKCLNSPPFSGLSFSGPALSSLAAGCVLYRAGCRRRHAYVSRCPLAGISQTDSRPLWLRCLSGSVPHQPTRTHIRFPLVAAKPPHESVKHTTTYMQYIFRLCLLEMGKNSNPARTNRTRTKVSPRTEPNRTRTQMSWFLLGSFTEWNCR